jgi:hypothetical protein
MSATNRITVAQLFKEAGLKPSGPVPWLQSIEERQAGIYVMSTVSCPSEICETIDVSYLESSELSRWNQLQPVVYIGRATRSLKKRLGQFYRHKLGKRSPHAGGQAVKRLKCSLWVYWAPTEKPIEVERALIDAFAAKVGRLPFANRRR